MGWIRRLVRIWHCILPKVLFYHVLSRRLTRISKILLSRMVCHSNYNFFKLLKTCSSIIDLSILLNVEIRSRWTSHINWAECQWSMNSAKTICISYTMPGWRDASMWAVNKGSQNQCWLWPGGKWSQPTMLYPLQSPRYYLVRGSHQRGTAAIRFISYN